MQNTSVILYALNKKYIYQFQSVDQIQSQSCKEYIIWKPKGHGNTEIIFCMVQLKLLHNKDKKWSIQNVYLHFYNVTQSARFPKCLFKLKRNTVVLLILMPCVPMYLYEWWLKYLINFTLHHLLTILMVPLLVKK